MSLLLLIIKCVFKSNKIKIYNNNNLRFPAAPILFPAAYNILA
jgi:hypothetical protein